MPAISFLPAQKERSFYLNLAFAIVLIIGMSACGGSGVSSNSDYTEDTTDTTQTETIANGYNDNSPAPKTHNCTITGTLLDQNQVYLSDLDLLVCIKADSSTLDPDFGESHRVFEVYDTKNCSQLQRKVLPVNESPDFPYYLNEVELESGPMVVVRGFSGLYCFDPATRSLSNVVTPRYKDERYGEDAQSGAIRSVSAWDDYLIGFAKDFGTFSFDLEDKKAPKAVIPFAEHQGPDGTYHSLFMLAAEGEEMQVLIPFFDAASKSLDANPLLDNTMAISQNVAKNARDNRFLVLRAKDDAQTALAFDLEKNEQIELPANMAAAKTQDILKWVRDQQQQ